jgi:hypothetical protein
VRLVPSGSAPRTIYVEITRRAEGLTGTLRIVDGGGTDRRRSLKAARCDDTVDGLALVAAVALDPEGPGSPAPGTGPEAPATGSASPTAPSESSSPTPAPPGRPESPPAAARPEANAAIPPTDPNRVDLAAEENARAHRRTSETTEDPWHLLVGIGAGGLFGQAPGALPAFMFLVGTEWYVSPLWSPSIRASIVQTSEREFAESGGVVQYRATLGMIEACPFRFGPAQLAFRPCLAGDGGVATISGTKTQLAESHARWRWHFGASGLMALGVSKGINVTGAAGLLFPLRRDQVQFEPSVFFSDPAVSEFVRLDVTVSFP